MKKALSIVLALVMALSLAACGNSAGATAKTGMAIVATGAVSGEASADEQGRVQSNSTVAAVLVDAEGKIIDCKIDVAQTGTAYGIDGSVQDAAEVDVRSKMEKGTDYGMTPASPIGKEWDAQANAFAAYVIGKTAAEVEAIPQAGDHNGPDVADLAATCTMDVTEFKAAVVAAVNGAKELGASAGDKLGLGLVTAASGSAATADADGKIQHDTTFAVTTTNADGKITSNLLNVTQTKYTVSAEGVAACTTEVVTPKHELGDDYGMRVASPIEKEWFEQADAFMAYVNGKTADEISAIALVGDHSAPDVADLASTCTMNVADFQSAIAKAAK